MSALVTLSSELTEAILQQYGELQKLNLSSNGLQNIENIARLNTLQKLNLSKNDLIDIRPLAALLSLKELDLSGNRILDASPLHTLTALEVLDLRENAVTSLAGLRELSSLPQLRCLQLEGNPVCDTVGYAASVMLMFPTLLELDGKSRVRLLSSLEADDDGHDDYDRDDDSNDGDDGDGGGGGGHRHVVEGEKIGHSANEVLHAPSSSSRYEAASPSWSQLVMERDAAVSEADSLAAQLRRASAQLDALNAAFATQEEHLKLPAPNADANNPVMTGEEVLPTGFPYLTMLRKWREAACSALTEKALLEQAVQEKTVASEKTAATSAAQLEQATATCEVEAMPLPHALTLTLTQCSNLNPNPNHNPNHNPRILRRCTVLGYKHLPKKL